MPDTSLPARRAELARAERAKLRNPSDPSRSEVAARLRRDYAAAKLADHIQRTVNAAPDLSNEQRDRLALLLRGGDAA